MTPPAVTLTGINLGSVSSISKLDREQSLPARVKVRI